LPNSNCVGEIVQDQIALGRGYDKHKMPYAGRCLNDGQACSAGRYSVLDELMSFSCHSACNIDPLSRGIGVQN